MITDDQKRWIWQTLSEGGYSFSELRNYICKVEIKESEMREHLSQLIDQGFLEVYVSAPHSNQKIVIPKILQIECIKHYDKVVDLEDIIGPRHYFEVMPSASLN